MRGLKLLNAYSGRIGRNVASFTDAWIETSSIYIYFFIARVASFTDAWIETALSSVNTEQAMVASFTDAWIET